MIITMTGVKTHTLRLRVVAYDDATGKTSLVSSGTATFKGSFQPISGRDRARLPEGSRNTAREKIYSTTQMKTSTTSTSSPGTPPGDPGVADLVQRNGAWYEVITVEDWNDHTIGLPHYKYILALRDVDDLPE